MQIAHMTPTGSRAMKTFVWLLLLVSGQAMSAYKATSPIKGNVCKGFIIESCEMLEIAGVKGSDGKLYTVRTTYEAVDEYNEKTKRCWIKTKSKGAGWLSLGLNAISQPVFVSKSERGEYKELDVEYLTFTCEVTKSAA